MSKRYFELIDGSSAKFWEVSINNNEVMVRFGRIGTQGQTQTKSFPDATAATRHIEKLVASKTAKGYQETVAC